MSLELFTDLNELTMTQAYHAEHMDQLAVFELAFRTMPANRNYIVACGLDDVLEYLVNFRFSHEDLEYLRSMAEFTGPFLEHLSMLRFTGDVYAMPEGTVVFQNEPIIQVVAPIVEAQLMEMLIVDQIHFQSLATTKAARIVKAAKGRQIVDFGSHGAPGIDAALKVARATFLAGGRGTSNVLAAKRYGIPALGTMAHSYIQAHDDELDSFEAFARLYPQSTLLVDTYDTIAGVRKVIELKRRLGEKFRINAVRLDSGDIAELAVETRRLLDDAGLRNVQIFASSGLDEYQIDALVKTGAAIDVFGVGTKLAVIADAPELDMAYELVEYGGQGRLKLSSEKVLFPGRKQVFREIANGRMVGDTIGRFDEELRGEQLLQPVMKRGRRIASIDLNESRERLARQMDLLPHALHGLQQAAIPYSVAISDRLNADFERVRRKVAQQSIAAGTGRQNKPGPPAFPVVCIGLSAGGLAPLKEILHHLEPDTGMSFVVISHLQRAVPSHLSHVLAMCTPMPVEVAATGLTLLPNRVYVIPPDRDLTISDGCLLVKPRSKVSGWSNVITLFLLSLAKSDHPGIVVILSGVDADGAAALKSIRERGDTTIVQETRSAQHRDMPQAAIDTGFVDYVLPVGAIAGKLEEIGHTLQTENAQSADSEHEPIQGGSYNHETLNADPVNHAF